MGLAEQRALASLPPWATALAFMWAPRCDIRRPMMKRTSTILPILLGFGIATLLACGGVQNPYSPSINGTTTTTTGGGSFGLAIQPQQNTIYRNATDGAAKQGRGITFQRSTTFTLIIDFAG